MRYSIVGAALFGAVPLTSALVLGSSVPDLNATEMSAILNGPGPVVTSPESLEARMINFPPGPTTDNPSPSSTMMETAVQSRDVVPTIDIQATNPGWAPRHRFFGHGPAVHLDQCAPALPTTSPSSSEEILTRSLGTTDAFEEAEEAAELDRRNVSTASSPSPFHFWNRTRIDSSLRFKLTYPNLTAMATTADNSTSSSPSPIPFRELVLTHILARLFSLLYALHIPLPRGLWVQVNQTKTKSPSEDTELEIVLMTPTANATTTANLTMTVTPTSTATATASLVPRKFPILAPVDLDDDAVPESMITADSMAKRGFGVIPVYKWAQSTPGATAPPLPISTEYIHILPRRNGKYNQAPGRAGNVGVDAA